MKRLTKTFQSSRSATKFLLPSTTDYNLQKIVIMNGKHHSHIIEDIQEEDEDITLLNRIKLKKLKAEILQSRGRTTTVGTSPKKQKLSKQKSKELLSKSFAKLRELPSTPQPVYSQETTQSDRKAKRRTIDQYPDTYQNDFDILSTPRSQRLLLQKPSEIDAGIQRQPTPYPNDKIIQTPLGSGALRQDADIKGERESNWKPKGKAKFNSRAAVDDEIEDDEPESVPFLKRPRKNLSQPTHPTKSGSADDQIHCSDVPKGVTVTPALNSGLIDRHSQKILSQDITTPKIETKVSNIKKPSQCLNSLFENTEKDSFKKTSGDPLLQKHEPISKKQQKTLLPSDSYMKSNFSYAHLDISCTKADHLTTQVNTNQKKTALHNSKSSKRNTNDMKTKLERQTDTKKPGKQRLPPQPSLLTKYFVKHSSPPSLLNDTDTSHISCTPETPLDSNH